MNYVYRLTSSYSSSSVVNACKGADLAIVTLGTGMYNVNRYNFIINYGDND